MAEEKATSANSEQQNVPEFRMQKMYLKDFSFENPNAPEMFIQQSEPKVQVNLQLKNKKVDDDHYEVSIEVTSKVTTKDEEKVMFIIEVEHAAIYLMKNIPEEHLEMVLSVDCPTLLFPFTRQIISQVSVDGGFVPFQMEPINFAALYHNSKKKQQEQSEKKSN